MDIWSIGLSISSLVVTISAVLYAKHMLNTENLTAKVEDIALNIAEDEEFKAQIALMLQNMFSGVAKGTIKDAMPKIKVQDAIGYILMMAAQKYFGLTPQPQQEQIPASQGGGGFG